MKKLIVAVSCLFLQCSTNDEINPKTEKLQNSGIILQSFNVKSVVNNTVDLNWKTSKESGVNHFEVQRSKNLEYWLTVGTIVSKNKPSDYKFIDSKVNPCLVCFYRLKIVNSNEIFYSDTLGVTIKGIYY